MPLVYLAASWAAGIALANQIRLPLALWAWWLVFPLAAFLFARFSPRLRLVLFCLAAFLLGAIRVALALAPLDPNALAALNDHGAITLIGDVTDPPDVRDQNTNVRVAVARARVNNAWRDVTGLALVQAPRESDVRYGDRVEIYGEPQTPPEFADFSYKEYLARQGVHSLVRVYSAPKILARDQGNPFFAALYAFRDRAHATLAALFPEPAAALLSGILLGMDSGIPQEVRDAFSATNTAHIVAISGFNVSIIAGILMQLARRVLRPGLATLFVLIGLATYTLLVGASASVVRAAVMGGLIVIAAYYQRQSVAFNALAVAALAMTAWNPFTLFDLGFQLSFLATIGLVLYVEPLTRWFANVIARTASEAKQDEAIPTVPPKTEIASQTPWRLAMAPVPRLLSDTVLVTLAAQITTTPLIVFAFHRFSIIGIFTNLLVLPIQPAVMIWGGLAMLIGMIAQPLGQVLAWIAWAFTQWTIVVVQFTASLPFASVNVGYFDVVLVGAYYLALFGAPRVDWRAVREKLTLKPALAFGALFVLGFWLCALLFTAPDGRTHVEFLDAGGAATFVRAPNGTRALIDGGANPSATLAALGSRMPFWDRRIDLLVLTNPDDDHLAGLVAVLERYEVRQIVEPPAPARPSAAYLKWRELIAQKRVSALFAQEGVQIILDRAVELEIKSSVIARLRAGALTVLFAESAETKDQDALQSGDALASMVLVAPRKIAAGFVDAVNPTIAVLFIGADARDKPSAESLSALAGVTVLRTDERGTVELMVEGDQLQVRTAR